MSASPEAQTHQPTKFSVSREGYLSTAEAAFLDKFKQAIISHGLDPEQLVFSGFDGSEVKRGCAMPRYDHIFAKNEAAWLQAIEHNTLNPAQYAENYDVPCIGLYDKNQLTEAYDYKTDTVEEDADGTVDRTVISGVQIGRWLRDMTPDELISEAVVHVDYPDGSPTDALVALVFIEND